MTKRFFFPPLDLNLIKALASAGSVTVGSVVSGTYATTHNRDGVYWEIGEAAGTPGFTLTMDFSYPVKAKKLSIFGYYDGNIGHTVNVDAYNWTTTSYDTLGTIPDAVADALYTFSLAQAQTDSDGSIKIRINHTSAGNINHTLYLDKVHIS